MGWGNWRSWAWVALLVAGLSLPVEGVAGEYGSAKKKNAPDNIDRIVSLLPPPPGFADVRTLFLRFRLTVKSAMVAHVSDQDAILLRIDFFLPVPPNCHPSEEERKQYYLEEAVWTRSAQSDAFLPIDTWARHISQAQTEWFQNISCYP